jgi:cytidyltransferase-like protein
VDETFARGQSSLRRSLSGSRREPSGRVSANDFFLRRSIMKRKILIMGLPGAGKTALTQQLAPMLNAVVFNNDAVRSNINRDLGFSPEDRIEQARRMGWLCDRVVESGGTAIADFVCPTPEARAAFGSDAFVVFVDRIKHGRFDDTNALFVAPERYGIRVDAGGTPQFWAEQAFAMLRPVFDPRKPTALFVGRFQPFHAGHRRLIEEGLRRVGQVCIAVRDTEGIDDKNPLSFYNVKARIEASLNGYASRFVVVPLPNITHFFFGRDVGYAVERIKLDEETEAISATEARKAAALGRTGSKRAMIVADAQ